jgi:hypothetical protein
VWPTSGLPAPTQHPWLVVALLLVACQYRGLGQLGPPRRDTPAPPPQPRP